MDTMIKEEGQSNGPNANSRVDLRRPESIAIQRQDWEKMRSEAEAHSPEEACGLLAGEIIGDRYDARLVLPITNMLHSRVRYQLDPQEQLNAFNYIEEQHLELVGIYHSHPNGPDTPSPTDIAEAYYPEAVQLIWSHRTEEWRAYAYLIQEGQVFPLPLIIYN